MEKVVKKFDYEELYNELRDKFNYHCQPDGTTDAYCEWWVMYDDDRDDFICDMAEILAKHIKTDEGNASDLAWILVNCELNSIWFRFYKSYDVEAANWARDLFLDSLIDGIDYVG